MANNTLWSDDYWLLLIQLYQKKPVVELGIELHIPPRTIYEQMCALEKRATPSLQRLWALYADNPKRLARDIKRLKQMAGFGDSGLFYEGVQTTPSFERDYRPIDNSSDITPVMLVIILEILKRKAADQSPIADEAKRVWKRYYSEQPELLHAAADKLKLYFS